MKFKEHNRYILDTIEGPNEIIILNETIAKGYKGNENFYTIFNLTTFNTFTHTEKYLEDYVHFDLGVYKPLSNLFDWWLFKIVNFIVRKS